MEKQDETLENKRKFIEASFNDFLVAEHEKNSLIFDNLNTLHRLAFFAHDYWFDFCTKTDFSFDWNKVSKANFFENKELIENFFKEMNIEFDFESVIANGVIDLTLYDANDPDNYQDNSTDHYIWGKAGTCCGHKYISGYNNGLVTDSIIWLHEISHYRNESELPESQERALLTESVSFAMQFIYMDYLLKKGYTYEAQGFKYYELNNLFNSSTIAISLIRIFLVYIKCGNISETSYNECFKDGKYEVALNGFYGQVTKNSNGIYWPIRYALAFSLSLYMYISYMKDERFIDRIERLNNGLKERKEIEELLNIIGLSIYDSEILEKFRESFDAVQSEMIEYLNQKKY